MNIMMRVIIVVVVEVTIMQVVLQTSTTCLGFLGSHQRFQEKLRQRTASSSTAGQSFHIPAPIPFSDENEDILYCYAVGIPYKTNEKKLGSIKSWYQIPDNLNPRLVVRGEWCCALRLGVGIYKAYLLGGLRLPLNSFAREILHKLGIGINQLNPNA